MITTAGTSSYSSATIFKTLYMKSDLEMFRDSLGLKEFDQRIEMISQQIDDNKQDMTKEFNQRIEEHRQQIYNNKQDMQKNRQDIDDNKKKIKYFTINQEGL